MKRLRRFKVELLTVAALLSACATTDPATDKNTGQVGLATPPPQPPPTHLLPQPEGTPLPPRDPSIANNWPPEIKQLVDNMLTLYPKTPGERPPSVKEVETKMGITLTERPLTTEETRRWSKRYVIGGTRYIDPIGQKYGIGDLYGILRAIPPSGMSQTLTLIISPRQSGFCLNPYELAVYTGSTFMNADTSPHAAIRFWPPAYVWGMFAWSNTGRYSGQGFHISIGQDRDPVTRKIISVGCVSEISVLGRYQEEK